MNLIFGPNPNIFFNFNNSLSSGMIIKKKIKINKMKENMDVKKISTIGIKYKLRFKKSF
jgi:hypothetical protein